MTTEIFAFRHGQTDWNLEHRTMGKTDIPLNDVGRDQALKLASRLSEFSLDAIYSSPLSRAMETAQVVAEKQHLIVKNLPLLMEMDLGLFEGKLKPERVALMPHFDSGNDEMRQMLKMDTFGAWIPKLKKTMKELLEIHEGQRVAFSTHDQKMRALLIALGMPSHIRQTVLPNTALTHLRIEGRKTIVVFHADTRHLSGEEHV